MPARFECSVSIPSPTPVKSARESASCCRAAARTPGPRPGKCSTSWPHTRPTRSIPPGSFPNSGLTDARKTPYRRLSGGQQQRLSLACALVGRPELVFLDEPTAGLDAQARLLVWELIDALRRDGVSVLLTTHLMDEAEALADELVIIDHGKIVASGTPAEVTSKGAEGQLRLTTVPGLSLDSLAGSLAGFRIEESNPGTYVVEGAIDPATVATVATWCADQDVLINDIRVDQRSLEDVFLELTGRELRG